ncbi:MAG: nicotinate-nucleotide adenylyltransferase [Chromatiales bacterium]|jgi:nicotinate-nucleotide adenylyltransferase|nr:nicotinate-nucleotide adenylyltransferase [Chromatiales bacterium]
MVARPAPVGLLGGSFDPVHVGHLRTAWELFTDLKLAEVRFIPSRVPPHRAPAIASGALRLRMLEAAIAGQPGFVVDDRELRREGPSYTVDTLAELRAGQPQRPLVLILGMDAFLGLPTWHRWREIAGLAHIVVVQRPGWPQQFDGPFDGQFDGEIGRFYAEHQLHEPAALAAAPAGGILLRQVTQLEIASSSIRALLASGGDPRYLVPDGVRELMQANHIYQRP